MKLAWFKTHAFWFLRDLDARQCANKVCIGERALFVEFWSEASGDVGWVAVDHPPFESIEQAKEWAQAYYTLTNGEINADTSI